MYWTKIKIAATILFVAGLGGAGAALWAAASKATDDAAKPDDGHTIARNKAISRLNLKKMAFAMHRYADANKPFLPPSALINKEGKETLSWRVLILPYLGESALYEQFKLSEPWDSEHNKRLLSKMPKVFAPPGVKTRQPFSTFYQVFVSPKPKDRRKGAENNGVQKGEVQAAFVRGQPQLYPAHFPDGLANTILIVEGGKAVPWTKPEDLPYEADKPLPELGGLFPDVFHSSFADGKVHTLPKIMIESGLRSLVTSNGLDYMILDQNEFRTVDAELLELRYKLEDARELLRLLREERDAAQGRPSADRPPNAEARLEEVEKEHTHLQKELEKTKEESRSLEDEIRKRLR